VGKGVAVAHPTHRMPSFAGITIMPWDFIGGVRPQCRTR
jgi:hypothetical protein